MRAVYNFLRSRYLTLVVMGAVVAAGVVALIYPQGPRVTGAELVAWAKLHPLLVAAGRPVGAMNVFASWWFLAAAALLFVNGSLCLVEQIEKAVKLTRKGGFAVGARMVRPTDKRRIATTGLGPEEAISVVVATLTAAGLHVREGKHEDDPALLAVGSGWSQWATVVFHASLLLSLVSIVLLSLTYANGSFRVAAGGRFQDAPGAYGRYSRGALGPESLGGWNLKLAGMQPRYKRTGFTEGPAASAIVRAADGSRQVDRTFTKGESLNVDGTDIFQTGSWGFAAVVSVAQPGKGWRKGSLFLLPAGAGSPTGDFEAGGPLRGSVAVLEPTGSADRKPKLQVKLSSGKKTVLSAQLQRGETARVGGVSVRYNDFIYWSEFKAVRNSWLLGLEIAFWFAVAGLSATYLWPTTYAWALTRPEQGLTAVYVGGRREKFSQDFADMVHEVQVELEAKEKETM